jgi:hypothetical protein
MRELIYVMSPLMYAKYTLSQSSGGYGLTKPELINYLNQTVGTIGTIVDVQVQ